MNGGHGGKPASEDRTHEFLRLMGEHDGRLMAFILCLVPHWSDADEIAQDVRLRLWQQFDDFDRKGDFGAWARTIAYYKILAFRKTATRRHASLSDHFVELMAQHEAPESDVYVRRSRALLDCLNLLDPTRRELLKRYYAGSGTFKEIAEQTGKSFDALRQAVLRTRKALAKCIQRRLDAKD